MVEIFRRGEKEPKEKESSSVASLRKIVGGIGKESLFTSLSSFPKRVCFEVQNDKEVVVLFMRQHPIVNLPWILLTIFLLTLPSVFMFFPPYAKLPGVFQMVLSLSYYLFVMGLALGNFMAWFYNIYILTDERIVDVDFVNLFYRVVSTAKIDEIQDVNVVSSGMLETFFNMGSVFVQTAAEVPEFEFSRVPQPDKVGKLINQMIDEEEQEKLEGRVK
ncbi:MAG: hypothetical protein ABII80_00405 [bacterium]